MPNCFTETTFPLVHIPVAYVAKGSQMWLFPSIFSLNIFSTSSRWLLSQQWPSLPCEQKTACRDRPSITLGDDALPVLPCEHKLICFFLPVKNLPRSQVYIQCLFKTLLLLAAMQKLQCETIHYSIIEGYGHMYAPDSHTNKSSKEIAKQEIVRQRQVGEQVTVRGGISASVEKTWHRCS